MMQEIPSEIKPGDQVTAKAEFIMLNRDDQKWLPLFTSLPELQSGAQVRPVRQFP